MAHRSERDALFAQLANECTHCGGQLQHEAARAGKPAAWRCAWCGRAGDYHMSALLTGKRLVVRVERVAGDPALRKPSVLADSVPYEERVS